MTQAGAAMHYSNTMVHISQLAVTSDVIRGAQFTNCVIMGPAVVLVLSGTVLDTCNWQGSPDALFFPLESSRESAIGVIGLEGCVFRGCQFQRVGLAYPEARAAELLSNFKVVAS